MKARRWHFRFRAVTLALALVLAAGCSSRRPGDPLHPGFNVYSRDQDIELGRQAAQEVRGQVDVVDNRELQSYISELGKRLAMQPNSGGYPYTFTLINDHSINAFALPGGPIFVHSGLLEAADNEAQVAGVLAHEIGHVALRHGTNQASKASLIQLPAVLAGAAIGQDSALSQLGQVGLGIGVNSVIMKYSRDAENQADAFGAKLMSSAGYNPIEMARFFEKLQAQGGGSGALQFLSSHPDPGNRVQSVEAEIRTFPARPYNADTGKFPRMKREVARLPEPRKPVQTAGARLAAPSSNVRRLETDRLAIAYPTGWQAFGDRRSAVVTLAPREGLVRSAGGSVSIGYGAVLSYYRPEHGPVDLHATTRELIAQFGSMNRGMQAGRQRDVRVDGEAALLTEMTGQSPYGGRERNMVLTVARPEGLFYLVFVAPEGQYAALGSAFERMVSSIDFRG